MNLKALDDYLFSLPHCFSKKSLTLMKNMVDPNSFKYQKIYKILECQKNQEINICSLTKKHFQLSLIDLYVQSEKNLSLKLNFELFANFLLNCKQLFLWFFKNKNQILKVVMAILVKIFLQWRRQFNSQIKKVQKSYQSLIELLCQVLVFQINTHFIQNQKHKIKIGYHQFSSPLSPPSPIFQQNTSSSNTSSSLNNNPNLSSNNSISLNSDKNNQTKQLEIKLEFENKDRQVITVMSEVYLMMLGMKYFNNQSKSNIQEYKTMLSNRSSLEKSSVKQESLYFNNQNFHEFLLHSLHIVFYLPNSLKHFSLCSILFELCSYLFIFNLNYQKPASLLRFVLFNETKLIKTQWQFHQIDKDEEVLYYWLLGKYIQLDPQFRSKTLNIISTCIDIGVQTQNRNLLSHWRVLIDIIKQRIFDGIVSEQMFKLLIAKSEGNIQAKMHIRELLNQMFLHLEPQYFIQNCQIVLSLEDFLSYNKVKLCQMFFEHYQNIYGSSIKQISNKTIINRIIQLYINIGKETNITRDRFLKFFYKILQNSVLNNQKILSQTLLKQIHMIHVTNQMKSQYNFQQMPVNLRQSNYRQIQKIQKQVYQFEQQLLKIIFQNVNQKGESYYSKFIRDPKIQSFTYFNTSSYEIYLCHVLQKLTNSNITMENIQKNIIPSLPIVIKSNPVHFNKYKAMFQKLFEYINHHKVLSFNIFKLMITIQSIIEQNTLSPRYQWYLRKFKYIIKTQPQKQSFLKIPNSPNQVVSTIFQDRRFYGKIEDQSNESQIGQQLFQYLKKYFIKIKSKISLLLYLSNFAAKLYFEFKQRRKLNYRDMKNDKQVCSFFKQLKQLFSTSQYLKVQSFSVESVYMLFIIFHIYLLEQHHQIFSQQIISVDNKKNKLFLEKEPLDTFSQIIKQLSPLFDYFFQNQLIHLFTFKQSIGYKLILLLNFPFKKFQSISIGLRLTTLIKVLSKLIESNQSQNKLYLTSNSNHIELQFMNLFKKDSILIKNQEVNYRLSLHLMINQNVKIDNFLSLHTTQSKYKIILRQNQICLLQRKNGVDKNQTKIFQIKQNFGQALVLDILLTFSEKNSNQMQFTINKVSIFKISIEGNIQTFKLQMIGYIILKKMSIVRTCSEVHYNSQPIRYDIALDKSFSIIPQVQVQTKIKNLNLITLKKFNFMDSKFLVILKEIFKHNTQLLQYQTFSNFWKIINQIIYKNIQKITNQSDYKKNYIPIDKAKKIFSGKQFVCSMKQLLKVMIQKYDQYHKIPLPQVNRKYSSNQTQIPKLKRSYTCTSNQEEDISNNNLNLPMLPQIQRETKIIESNKFYYYFISTCLNKTVWKLYSDSTKIIICKYLKNLLSVENFKIKIENLDFQLFFNLANIFCINQDFLKKKTPQIQEEKIEEPKEILIKCLKNIIITHQTNIYLKQKFKYYFYLSENNESTILKTTFYEIIQFLAQNLIIKTPQSEKIFKISKYIFIDFQQFEYVFINCNINIKIKILDYLALSQNQNKLEQFLKQLTPKIILQLKLWLIVFIKKLLFQLTIRKNKVLQIMKILGMITQRLLSCWQQIREEQQKQQLLKIIKQEIKYIRNRQKQNQYISPQLLKILRDQEFIKFLITIIEQYIVLRKKTDIQIQKFLITVFEVLFSLQKKQLLQVLIKYRKFANKNIGVLLYPIQLQLSKQLQLYQLNCFLQFIIESILSIQNSLSEQQLFYYAIVLKGYLQYLFKFYEKFNKISGALLYTYPKHYHSVTEQSKIKIKKQMKNLNFTQTLQLKGGIYYKLMIIVAHLIQMKKDQDLSFFVQEILFKKLSKQTKQISFVKQQRASLANLRTVNDFTELKFYNKERTFVQIIINQLNIDHKTYFLEKDQAFKSQQVASSKLIKFQQQNDLTPYYIDYFLMKLVIYLQWLQQDCDQKTNLNNKKYSELVLKAFQKYPLVYGDIVQQNIDSRICVNDYYDLVLLTQNEQDLTVTQQIYSPHSRIQNMQIVQPIFSPHNLEQSYPELQSPRKQIRMYQNERFSKTADKKQIESNFLQVTPNPKKTTNRRKSFDITQHIKQKQNLINEIKENHHTWRTKCLQKQFNKYFRDQAKQLLLFQLIHTYFVQNSQIKPKSQLFQKTNQVIQKYFQLYQQQLEDIEEQLENQILQSKHLIKSFGIKLIAPYLINQDPIYKIKANYFPNFCLPILSKIPVRSYKLRQKNLRNLSSLVNEQDLNMSIIEGIHKNNLEEQFQKFQLKQELMSNAQQKKILLRKVQTIDQKTPSKSYICIQDKSVQSFQKDQKSQQIRYCQLVTRKGVMFCEWRIFLKKIKDQEGKQKEKTSFLQIKSLNQKPLHGPRYLKYGSPQSNLLLHQKKFFINLTQIKEILYRKYNQIINNSIQIFQKNGRSHFICMYQKQRAEQLIKQIRSIRGKKIKIVKNLVKQFQDRNYTNMWASGEIDNFTYLMLINKFSSRSFCDTNQYPIFPWVIADFNSQQLDLTKKQTYRDLTLPVGAINPKKLDKFYQKYNMQSQDTGFYLYGSHYSTSLFIYYFLVRMEPFSSLHQQMQGGNWDVPDRLFSSIPHMWESLMSQSSPTDIKQSIPQFYYFPSFLKNINNIQLGKRQSGQLVNDVALPKWAKSAQQFVMKMRCALQSTYVSLNLPHWINLIFGVWQKDIKKHNLFHPLSYSQNINIENIPDNVLQATVCQISFFGQSPSKLFSSQHRQRKLALPNIFSKDLLSGSLIRSRSSSNAYKNNNFGKYTLTKEGLITKIIKCPNSKTKCYIFFKFQQDKQEGVLQFDCENDQVQFISKKLQIYSKSSLKERQRNYKQKKQQISKSYPSLNKSQFDTHYVGYAQPSSVYIQSQVISSQIRIVFKDNRHILTSFIFPHSFSSYFYNQMFLILYGNEGLFIYDWKYQLYWRSNCKQVLQCFVQDQLIFFANRNGQIFVYDMIQTKCKTIFDFQSLDQSNNKGISTKEKTYDLMIILFHPKIGINNSQFEDYKFFVVENKRKIRILSYKHQRLNWLKHQQKQLQK